MRDVPKFVLKRLGESEGGETHPDADLLTGFVEKTLIESERKQVMEHLARCSTCRETVALALPATEDVATEDLAPIASVKPARSRWFSWAALGWGAATVAIVAITVVGIREYRVRTNDASRVVLLSRNEAPPLPKIAATPPQDSAGPVENAPREKNGEGANSERKAQPKRPETFSVDRLEGVPTNGLSKPQPASPHAHAAAAAGRAAGVASGSARVQTARTPEAAPTSNPSSNPDSNVAQEASVPPASETVEVQVETEDTIVPASPGKKDSGKSVNKSVNKKEAVGDQSSKSLASKNLADGAASPRWSISSEGVLQRSMDAGQTWVSVNPAQEYVPSSAAETTEIARGLKKNAQKKSDASPNPAFRAVAAFGSEVWAGGSAATLYHSTDSGDHWTRIIPFAGGAMLTGDISSIDFSDPQNGVITTSTGEVWLTADGGRTWRR